MVTINITRANIYTIAEGISVKISQHNGGVPTYEQLWASTSESKKLDIYYRDAISDLEQRLMKWAEAVSGQFNLIADGTDYTLQITLSQYWPTKLEGLLKNKVQNYLVHAVTAGWLGDFEGLTIKQDYGALAGLDLTDIRDIIYQREFDFTESARADEGDSKDMSYQPSAGERNADDGKDTFVLPREAGFRRKDDVIKEGPDNRPAMARERTDRHTDNDIVHPHTDWCDQSGTGIGYMDRMPKPRPYDRLDPRGRISRQQPCRGHSPSVDEQPVPPVPPIDGKQCVDKRAYTPADPRLKPDVYPEPPYHAIPPKYAPEPPMPEVYPNGIDWDDEQKIDARKEQEFVESHECGHHDCEGDMFDFVDDDEESSEQ